MCALSRSITFARSRVADVYKDVPLVAGLAEGGDVAGVVNVRVREDHAIYGFGIKWQVAIARDGFLAAALKHAALQKYPVGVCLNSDAWSQ